MDSKYAWAFLERRSFLRPKVNGVETCFNEHRKLFWTTTTTTRTSRTRPRRPTKTRTKPTNTCFWRRPAFQAAMNICDRSFNLQVLCRMERCCGAALSIFPKSTASGSIRSWSVWRSQRKHQAQCFLRSWGFQLVLGSIQQRRAIQCRSQSWGFSPLSGSCSGQRPHIQCWS